RKMDRDEFRQDLYYRLNVVPMHLPPLRERRADVPLLAEHFVAKICQAEGSPLKAISPAAVARLCAYHWPGNVRQLENAVERAIALSGERTLLDVSDFLLPAPEPAAIPLRPGPAVFPIPEGGLDYTGTLARFERSILQQALERTGGNKKAAAEML